MSLFATSRALAFRPRAIASIQSPIAASWRRNYATDPKQSGGAGPNMHQQEHISEEAAKMAKIQGGQGPDLEMGTPVQELLEEDKEAQKNAPQVLKDSIKAGAQHPKPSQTRSFSTCARSRQEELSTSNESPFDEAIVANTNFVSSKLQSYIAPLLRIRSQRGAAGGGVALQIPVPLGLRQRRRTAFEWILDAASKRKSRGSGRDMFALRVAEEIVAIIEGRSSAWEKRTGIHKIATTARSNLTFGKTGLRR